MRPNHYRFSLQFALILFAALALGLSGCASSSSSSSKSKGGNKVLTVSGTHVDLSGTTWTRCYMTSGGGYDQMEVQVFSADGLTLTITTSQSNLTMNGTCGGTLTTIETYDVTLGSGSDETLSDWSDNSVVGNAPTAIDGTTVIPDPPEATAADASTTGFSGKLPLLVDDTGAPRRLYRSTDTPTDPCGAVATEDMCLDNTDYLVEQ